MPNLTSKLVAAAAALAISACVVGAQTTAPPPAPTTPKAAAPAPTEPKKSSVPKKATTPAGIKCSADADAKGLHGKERRKFRSACIRDFKKAETAKKS